MLSLRAKLLIPTLLTTLLALVGVVYISALHYKTFQHAAEEEIAHYKQDIHELINDVQKEVDHFVELLSGKWQFLDNVAAQNMDLLLNELTPFHQCLLYDFIAVYDMEGIIIARGDSPDHFGRSDSLYPHIMEAKENKAGIPLVALKDNKFLVLKLKSLDAGYGPIGVIAAGKYLDEKMVNNFSRARGIQLAFLYKDAVVVTSNNFKLHEPTDKNHSQIEFTDKYGPNSHFSAMLWEDTSKATSIFLNNLFMVIIIIGTISCLVIFFSRRIVIDTVNALSEARDSAERELIERKQAERTLQQLNDELEGRVQKRTQDLEDEIEVRKEAEADLSKQHYFLQKAQEIGKIGTWDLDLIKNKLLWTDENYEIFGVPLGTDLTYDTFLDCVHPDDRDHVNTEWKASFTGKPYDIEHRLIVNGKVKWVREKAVLEFNENDECVGGIGFTQDITEQKLDKEEIREKEAHTRSILRAAPTGIGVVCDRVIQQVNNRLCEMVGYSKDELLGQNARLLYLSDEEFEWVGREKYAQIQKMGTGTVETRFQRKGGKVINVLLSSTPIHPDDLSVGVTFTALDITERKKTEKALRESEYRFRSMMEAITDAIYICSQDLEIEYMNQVMIDRLGYDATGKQCYKSIHGLNARCGWCQFSDPKQKKFNDVEIKSPLDGRFYLVSQSPIVHSDAGISKLTIYKDVDEVKRTERQLRQAQKMEAVGRLAGGVAHDFNNMLSVILGNSEILLEDVGPDQLIYENVKEIKKAGKRSADITRQLLAFARKQAIAPRVLDLNKAIAGTLKMVQRLIGEDINIEWLPGESIWPVKIDPSQLDQILTNLSVNARDAIADVGTLTIETGNEIFDELYCSDHPGFVPGDFVQIVVSDTGCGMEQETMKNIFEPFFTTKAKDKGTGLGLATVYGIAKQNGGFINVYTEKDEGTSFKIYFPRYHTAYEEVSENSADGPNFKGSETILLVEDEPSILKMASMMLKRLGYTVIAANLPGEAISLARAHKDIHLLMTDVIMPEMNGRNLAKNILSIHPKLKCLYMSGYTANVIAHHGVLDEDINFIQKPFSRHDLSAKVREILHNVQS